MYCIHVVYKLIIQTYCVRHHSVVASRPPLLSLLGLTGEAGGLR